MELLFENTVIVFEEEEVIFFDEKDVPSFEDGDHQQYYDKERRVVSIPSREERRRLASDAAELGRLTRLNEHVIESIASYDVKKTTYDGGAWTGVKDANQMELRSAYIRISMEAAALGRIYRGNERAYTVTNWDEDEYDTLGQHSSTMLATLDETNHSMISNALSTLTEAEYQLEDLMEELAALGECSPDSIDGVLEHLNELQLRVDSLFHHLHTQPNRVTMLIDESVKRQREDISKSWSHHISALEDLEAYQATKETFEEQDLAVIPCLELPSFVKPLHYMTKKKQKEALAIQAARTGKRRTSELGHAKSLRIRRTCSCIYCDRPTAFQTQSYKRMRARLNANDKSLKKEIAGLARKKKPRRATSFRPLKSENEDKPSSSSEKWVSPTLQKRKLCKAPVDEPPVEWFSEWVSPSSKRKDVLEKERLVKLASSESSKPTVALRDHKLPPPVPPPKVEKVWVSPLSQRRKKANVVAPTRLQGNPSLLGKLNWVSPRLKQKKRKSKQNLFIFSSPVADEKPKSLSLLATLDWVSPRQKQKNRAIPRRMSPTKSKNILGKRPILSGQEARDERQRMVKSSISDFLGRAILSPGFGISKEVLNTGFSREIRWNSNSTVEPQEKNQTSMKYNKQGKQEKKKGKSADFQELGKTSKGLLGVSQTWSSSPRRFLPPNLPLIPQ